MLGVNQRKARGESWHKTVGLALFVVECYWLECDGMSNVIHYYLEKAKLPVVHLRGTVQLHGSYPVSHDWLTLGCWTIDYWLRIWYPRIPKDKVPNRIFRASDFKVTYTSQKLVTVIGAPHVIEFLEQPRPAPDWSAFAEAFRLNFEGEKASPDLKERLQAEMERSPAIRFEGPAARRHRFHDGAGPAPLSSRETPLLIGVLLVESGMGISP
jgi:hypothetical protein